jgi:hypothetical protein
MSVSSRHSSPLEPEALEVLREVGGDVDLVLGEATDQLAHHAPAQAAPALFLEHRDASQLGGVAVRLDPPESDHPAITSHGEELLGAEILSIQAQAGDGLADEGEVPRPCGYELALRAHS